MKSNRKFQLQIEIRQNGMVKPTFIFSEKGKRKFGLDSLNNLPIMIECPEFHFPNITVQEGEGFLGLDFGTCNSYVAKILGSIEDDSASQYPEFKVKAGVLDQLRQLELDIQELKAGDILTEQTILRHAQENDLLVIFHSNKIEGNPLSIGETEEAIEAKQPYKLSTHQREAYNLQSAYRWMLENLESCHRAPEAFIRHINKIILEGIQEDGGEYRKKPVKISGMEFTPPDSASVPAFMQKLGEEIKGGSSGRSILEFAATIHTKLVWIHPFTDANGRTARLLLNAVLLSNGLPILVVNYADKERYLKTLEDSNQGNISSLLSYLLENFHESIESIKSQCFGNGTCDQEAGIADIIVEVPTEEDPIRTAFEGIGVATSDDEDDQLALVMKSKISSIMKLKELNYEAWKQSYNGLKSEVFSIMEEFNAKYYSQGFSVKTADFGIIPFEKYLDIEEGKKFSRTWFLGLEVAGENAKERFLLFFNRSPETAPKGSSRVSLTLARFDGTGYQRITSEPISLREIIYKEGELIVLCSEGSEAKRNLRKTIRNLLAEIISSYM